MAVASSLATAVSLLPLRQASFSATAKPSFLSFSPLAHNLSLRLSFPPTLRLYAAKSDSDGFEPEEEAGGFDGDDSEYAEPLGDLDEFAAATDFNVDDLEEDGGTDEGEGDDKLVAEDSVSLDVCAF